MESAKIKRIDVTVTCPCGEDNVFDDANLVGSYESMSCDDCGKIIEIRPEVEATVRPAGT